MRTTSTNGAVSGFWRACAILGASAAVLLASCSGKTSDDSIQPIGVSDLSSWLQASPGKYMVIDARNSDAYRAGHIPGATRRTLPEVNPDDLDPTYHNYSAVIVYGEDPGSGVAKAITKRLMQGRVSKVYLFEGGMSAWRGSGLRVVSADSAE